MRLFQALHFVLVPLGLALFLFYLRGEPLVFGCEFGLRSGGGGLRGLLWRGHGLKAGLTVHLALERIDSFLLRLDGCFQLIFSLIFRLHLALQLADLLLLPFQV